MMQWLMKAHGHGTLPPNTHILAYSSHHGNMGRCVQVFVFWSAGCKWVLWAIWCDDKGAEWLTAELCEQWLQMASPAAGGGAWFLGAYCRCLTFDLRPPRFVHPGVQVKISSKFEEISPRRSWDIGRSNSKTWRRSGPPHGGMQQSDWTGVVIPATGCSRGTRMLFICRPRCSQVNLRVIHQLPAATAHLTV